jgi:hypothetical protein
LLQLKKLAWGCQIIENAQIDNVIKSLPAPERSPSLARRIAGPIALCAAFTCTSNASAAVVTYILDLSFPGTFALYADVSQGDNGGLVFYDVPLLGTVLTLDHRAPLAINGSNFIGAGFNTLRTPDSAGPITNPEIHGSQDVINAPPANRIYGFGQEASSWAAQGITPVFFPDATSDISWTAPLLLARGTYDYSAGSLDFDRNNLNLVASVWERVGSSNALTATVVLGGFLQFLVDDLFIGGGLPGSLITGGPLPTNDSDDPDQVAWTLESLVGPNGPVTGATVHPTTGVFTWQTLPTTDRGFYTATIRGTNTNSPMGSDTGLLMFEIPVPEPATVTLLALAIFGLLGFLRRR